MRFLARFRTSEWILLAYFLYVAVLAILFRLPAAAILQTWLLLAGVGVLFAVLARPPLHVARDWVPLALLLTAYREMDLFSVTDKARILENQWLLWDRVYLYDRGFSEWVEVLGPVFPTLLELSYVLVYSVGFLAVGALYIARRPHRVDQFLIVYLTGTVLSYALFPFFPSDPPRVVFAGADLPGYLTPIRRFNLALVGGYGIHSSVFPSAHVSAAFSAAWGLVKFLPEHRGAGLAMAVYAASVAIATVYGRYHYGVDALAGIAVSLIALAVAARMDPVPPPRGN